MKIREHKNIILTALTLIPMLVSTFFTFYRNAELYIDLQWKVIEALGNPALIVFMIFVILLFAAQALKIAAIIIALVIALIPWCNQIQKKRGCLLCP